LVATAAEKRLNIRPYTSFAAASDCLDVAERMNAAAAPGGMSWMWTLHADPRLRADARGRDGGVRQQWRRE
jgi:hypothetical protein